VELSFDLDGDKFIIRRYKTPKPDMKIFINNIDRSGKGIRESSKVLAQYLPDITSKFVDSVIILGQGLPNRFSNNNPAQRKEILEKLTKSDFMIQSIKDALEARMEVLKTQLRGYEDNILSNNAQLNVYNTQIDKLKSNIEKCSSCNTSLEEVNSNIVSTESLVETITKYVENLRAIVEDSSNKKAKLLDEYKDELSGKLKDSEATILDLTNKIATQRAEIKSLGKEIEKLDSITDICPTCGQKIPGANKPDTTEKKYQLLEMNTTLDELEKELAIAKDDKRKITKECDNKYNEATNELTESIKEKQKAIKEKSDQLVELNKELTRLTKESIDIAQNKKALEQLSKELEETTKIVDELNTNVSSLNSQITTTNAHCTVVQQMITLAKREFRGVLLQNFIEFINKKVKKYSKEVFGTTELSFTLNENCIDITYCNKPYENLSGGEKQKIDIIVQLALRDILSKQLNVRTNILVCDEVLDNIDSVGAEKIINIIQSQSDIESIFFITHHTDILNMSYDKVITVEKNEEGISTIMC